MKPEDLEKWMNVSTKALISHIQSEIHPALLKNLSEVMDLFAVVHKRHGEENAKLSETYLLLSDFAYRIPLHLLCEEQVLFPLLLELEKGSNLVNRSSISSMKNEHLEDLALVAKSKELTNQFQAPDSACQSWKKLYRDLGILMSDLEIHIAIENDVLLKRFQENKGHKIEI